MSKDLRLRQKGQSSLEMALTFPIVFVLIMGCLELGLAFNAYVSVVAATREGARAGAVYLYDSSASQTENDQNRESGTGTAAYDENIRDTVAGSLGILKTSSPNFDKNSDDVKVTYIHIPSTSGYDTRKGDLVSVRVAYRHDFLTKILSTMPTVTLTAEATARIE